MPTKAMEQGFPNFLCLRPPTDTNVPKISLISDLLRPPRLGTPAMEVIQLIKFLDHFGPHSLVCQTVRETGG
jgi:hypothetical protein